MLVTPKNDHITLTGGPKDGNACQGGHVFGDIGQDGNAAVSAGRTPMSQNGPRKTPGVPGLDDGGPDYGRHSRTKKDEIGAVSLPDGTPSGLASLVGPERLAGSQHVLRTLSPSAQAVSRGHQVAGSE